MELRIKLEPKGQIRDLYAPRESRKPGSQSEWVSSHGLTVGDRVIPE